MDKTAWRLALALLLCAASCTEPGTDTPAGTVIETLPTGTVVVSDSERPDWQSNQPWELVEDLRLGTVDGGGPEQFSLASQIRVGQEGQMYVFDYLSKEVRVFSAEGAHLRTIGRGGEGPGEFGGVHGMFVAADGRLWTIDPDNRRYSVFGSDGEFQTSYPQEIARPMGGWLGVVDAAGALIDWGYERFEDPDPAAGTTTLYYPIRTGLGAAAPDTAPPLSYIRYNASNGTSSIPFSPALAIHQDHTGAIWFAHEDEYRIYRRTMAGDTTLVVSLDASPPVVSDAERDSILRAEERFRPEARLAASDIPATKPIVRGLFTDGSRFLYVLPEFEGWPVGSVLDVFRITGEYVGRLEPPERISLPYPQPQAVGDHLYIGVRDELDVNYVVRWRIVRREAP